VSSDRPSLGFGMPLGAGTRQQEQRREPGSPEGEEVARFERLLEAKPAEAATRPASEGLRAGDLMLRLMGAGPRREEGSLPSAARLFAEVAGRLLVSDPLHGQGAEVRVAVKDEIFPGLEVRIREEAGRLVVELASASAGDLALLRADAPAFTRRLAEKMGREVEVRLKLRTAEGEQDADGAASDEPEP
jgi:hypothetical protein